MNDISMLPTVAQEREAMLAELRVHRIRFQFAATSVDSIGVALKHGIISTCGAKLMLAELYGDADQAAESEAA